MSLIFRDLIIVSQHTSMVDIFDLHDRGNPTWLSLFVVSYQCYKTRGTRVCKQLVGRRFDADAPMSPLVGLLRADGSLYIHQREGMSRDTVGVSSFSW